MVFYEVSMSEFTNNETGVYTSYGIKASDDSGSAIVIDDLFSDRSEAQKCADIFNKHQLELIHLDQMIEDCLKYGLEECFSFQ